jgi:hypothetical protein
MRAMASVLALASRVKVIVVCVGLPVYGAVNGLRNAHVGRAITGLGAVSGAF